MNINWEAISEIGPMAIAAVGILIAVIGTVFAVNKELFGKPKPKHPDSQDVRLRAPETFFVRMGERTAAVDCDHTPRRWRIYLSEVDCWQAPHRNESFTDSDRDNIRRKLKNVLESEGSAVSFK